MPIDLATALAAAPVVLDGGLATELERRGHDLSSDLWSARLLTDDPAEIVAAHSSFLAAGARIATTASYQASFDGFAAAGIDAAGTRRLLRRSVELAREAVDASPSGAWVAASVGPYGAARADGSEYTGAYGPMLAVPPLRRFHHDRLAGPRRRRPGLSSRWRRSPHRPRSRPCWPSSTVWECRPGCR